MEGLQKRSFCVLTNPLPCTALLCSRLLHSLRLCNGCVQTLRLAQLCCAAACVQTRRVCKAKPHKSEAFAANRRFASKGFVSLTKASLLCAQLREQKRSFCSQARGLLASGSHSKHAKLDILYESASAFVQTCLRKAFRKQQGV